MSASQGLFRLLSVDNRSPFDATVRLVDRRQPPVLNLELGKVSAGEQKCYEEFPNILNGEEVQLQIRSDDLWTPSIFFMTYTKASLRKIRYSVQGTKQFPAVTFDGVVQDAITTPLPPLADHNTKSEQVRQEPIPEVSDELKGKLRWMQCVVQNQTQFKIVHEPPPYLDSGRYDHPPTNIDPYSNMIFTCCNRDYAITGATGGTAFRIILDDAAEYHFALGWTSPLEGSYTAGVIASTNAKDGYDAATEIGNAIKSQEQFSTTDKDGKETKFRFELSATPGSRSVYAVYQMRLPGKGDALHPRIV